MRSRNFTASALLAAALLAAPAFAHDQGPPPPPPPPDATQPGWQHMEPPEFARQREDWLAECRRRLSDNGVGGAVIGGVVGGLAGNALAGRHDKAVGTIAGAAVGAVAGAAIDKAEDRGRVADRCEAMLQGYGGANGGGYAYAGGYPAYGYGYGYGVPVMMVPVMMMPAPMPPAPPRRNCKETVTTEYVTTYEPVRHRLIPRRPAPHDKRVPMVPDKRVRGS